MVLGGNYADFFSSTLARHRSAGGTGPAGPHAVSLIGGTSIPTPYRLTYDANGSVVSETTGLSYSYNFDGRLATSSDTGATVNPNTSITYDANGERARKTWTNTSNHLQDLRYWAGYEELRDGSTLHTDRYVSLNGARVALIPSNGTSAIYYLHPDIQGTVGLVTSKTGTVVERERFAPFGGPAAQTGTTPDLRYGYTGQEHDNEIGQIHLGARELHFTIARMLQPDSIVPNLASPQSLNRYAYAYNNPIRYTDPSGYEPVKPAGTCGEDHHACDANDKIAALHAMYTSMSDAVVDTAKAFFHMLADTSSASEPSTQVKQLERTELVGEGANGSSGHALSAKEAQETANLGQKAVNKMGDVVGAGTKIGIDVAANVGAAELGSKVLAGALGLIPMNEAVGIAADFVSEESGVDSRNEMMTTPKGNFQFIRAYKSGETEVVRIGRFDINPADAKHSAVPHLNLQEFRNGQEIDIKPHSINIDPTTIRATDHP